MSDADREAEASGAVPVHVVSPARTVQRLPTQGGTRVPSGTVRTCPLPAPSVSTAEVETETMSDDINFTGLKYADLLGKPLTKSLYRQLPNFPRPLVHHNGLRLEWRVIVHGKINWHPPGCTKTGHQHLLVGADGGLFQAFLSTIAQQYHPGLFLNAASQLDLERYQSQEEELQKQVDTFPLFSGDRDSFVAWKEERDRDRKRLAEVKENVRVLSRTGMVEFYTWLPTALQALPVILLRG